MKARQMASSFFNAGILKRKDKFARTVPSNTVASMHEGQRYLRDKEKERVENHLNIRKQEEEMALQQLQDYQQCVFRY